MSTLSPPPEASPESLVPSVQTVLTALLPVLLPLGVLLLQYLVWDLIAPYAFAGFLPAVVLCGWLSGLRGGLLSVVVSVAAAEWLLSFDDGAHGLVLEARIFSTLVFTFLAGGVVIMLDQVRRERERLHAAVAGLKAVALGMSGAPPEPSPWRPWERHFASDLAAIHAVRRELSVRRACANAVDQPFATFAGDGRCLFANDAFLAAVQQAPGDWHGRNALDPTHFPGTGLSGALRRLQNEIPPCAPVSVQLAGRGECQLIWVMTDEGGVALFAPLIPSRSAARDPVLTPPVPGPASRTEVAPSSRPAPREVPATTSLPVPSRTVPRAVGGLRCLVVDDQEINRELLRELLELDGAVPVCVASGREALAAISRRPEDFDVVLLDLQMPGMDGYATARAIRSLVDSATLPILAITADGPGVPAERLRDAGIQGLLHKPLDVNRMMALLADGSEAGVAPGGAAR